MRRNALNRYRSDRHADRETRIRLTLESWTASRVHRNRHDYTPKTTWEGEKHWFLFPTESKEELTGDLPVVRKYASRLGFYTRSAHFSKNCLTRSRWNTIGRIGTFNLLLPDFPPTFLISSPNRISNGVRTKGPALNLTPFLTCEKTRKDFWRLIWQVQPDF